MEFKPTPEQTAIIDASTSGESVAVNAVAGAGKTSTLKLLADANSGRSKRYVAQAALDIESVAYMHPFLESIKEPAQ